MGRKAKGPRIIYRGTACWVEWADGNGGKIRRRLRSVNGRKFRKDDPNEEIIVAAAAAYYEWIRVPETPANEFWKAKTKLTVGDLTAKYAMAYALEWALRTQGSYARYMAQIENYFGVSTAISEITPEMAEDFKLWLSLRGKVNGSGLASRSANNVLDFARSVFRYGQRVGWLSKNVFELVKPRRTNPVVGRDPFSATEVEKLLNVAKSSIELGWFYPVVLCIALTGSRRGPLPKMLVSDYDSARKLLTLRGDIAKQGRSYVYAVPDVLAKALAETCAGRELTAPLFIQDNGRPLNIKAFDPPNDRGKAIPQSRAWYRLLHIADVRPRGVHNLRRAAVSNLAEANVSMEKIVAVTGQSVEVARQSYLRFGKESQRKTMEKLATIYGQSTSKQDEG